MNLNTLFEIQKKKTDEPTKQEFKRYLYQDIAWEQRLIVLVGMRGVGKTTTISQRLEEVDNDKRQHLYISADNTLVASLGIFNIAFEFERNDGQLLAIDEVHRYPNWEQEIKSIYDSFPRLSLIISGSSAVSIIDSQFDLSRRAISYNLRPLSFREYLNLVVGQHFGSKYKLSELMKDHVEIATYEIKKIQGSETNSNPSILDLFHKYLKFGDYPYFLEGENVYSTKLHNAVSKVLNDDIPSVYNLDSSSTRLMAKLLTMIANSEPFEPNISSIASDLKTSRDTIYDLIDYMTRAGLLIQLSAGTRARANARKPEKIMLSSANLYYAFSTGNMSIGSIREVFLTSQLWDSELTVPKKHDLFVDQQHVFEVGGRSKQTIDSSVIYAIDDIEIGYANKIPLWLFGFLY